MGYLKKEAADEGVQTESKVEQNHEKRAEEVLAQLTLEEKSATEDHEREKDTEATTASSSAAAVAEEELPKISTTDGAAAVASPAAAEEKEEPKDTKKKKNRCALCKKKVGLTGFTCRCGGLFCGIHRYSDKHDCNFDYKAMGEKEISEANPVIVAQKINKI